MHHHQSAFFLLCACFATAMAGPEAESALSSGWTASSLLPSSRLAGAAALWTALGLVLLIGSEAGHMTGLLRLTGLDWLYRSIMYELSAYRRLAQGHDEAGYRALADKEYARAMSEFQRAARLRKAWSMPSPTKAQVKEHQARLQLGQVDLTDLTTELAEKARNGMLKKTMSRAKVLAQTRQAAALTAAAGFGTLGLYMLDGVVASVASVRKALHYHKAALAFGALHRPWFEAKAYLAEANNYIALQDVSNKAKAAEALRRGIRAAYAAQGEVDPSKFEETIDSLLHKSKNLDKFTWLPHGAKKSKASNDE